MRYKPDKQYLKPSKLTPYSSSPHYAKMRKLLKAASNPKLVLMVLWMKFSHLIGSDRLYLKVLYQLKVGKSLNLRNPQRFNEKLQWLKLNYRDALQTRLVDKYEAKIYVSDLIGEKYVIPTLGIWKTFEEIDFDGLPSQFVLKTTHDQGGVVICPDKKKLNFQEARQKIEKHLKRKHFLLSREWPYKNVKPRIIAEQYMVDESGIELKDYKFFCFDGVPRALFVATERQTGDVKFDFFDTDFNHLDFVQVHNQSKKTPLKPRNFDEMLRLSKILSAGFPHVRVDFYNINGEIYFGEFTFFHHGGLVGFHPEDWDYKFGSWLNLPEKAGNQ